MLFPYIDSWKTEILLMNVFTGTQEYPSARKTNNQTRNANDSYKRTRSWKLSLGWTYYQTTIDRFGRVDSTLVIIHLMWLNSAFESSIDTGPVHTSSKKFESSAILDLCLRIPGQGNHLIVMTLSFSKSFKMFSVNTKRKTGVFKFIRFDEHFQNKSTH